MAPRSAVCVMKSENTVTSVATRALLNMAPHKPRPTQRTCTGSAQSLSCQLALEIIFSLGFCCNGKDCNAKTAILLILQNYIKTAWIQYPQYFNFYSIKLFIIKPHTNGAHCGASGSSSWSTVLSVYTGVTGW